jgi:hypothetical protein
MWSPKSFFSEKMAIEKGLVAHYNRKQNPPHLRGVLRQRDYLLRREALRFFAGAFRFAAFFRFLAAIFFSLERLRLVSKSFYNNLLCATTLTSK